MGINGLHNLNYEAVSTVNKPAGAQPAKGEQPAFGTLLEGKLRDSLNFSRHAARRLDERGIEVDNQLMANLEHAVEEARKKGSRDVAVIGREGVFIVNVPNNVVVTTMSQEDTKDKIFTNIDSAVLM